jgi:DNA-3-methyladenine glycosylase
MKTPSRFSRLPRTFYDRPTELVARDLLGQALVRRLAGKLLGGLIVETEAYLSQGDMASHSSRGKTPGNAAMFGDPGTLYVYPIHAKYCMNAVTESAGIGSAVLIRAIEPLWGIEQMQTHRAINEPRRLTRGPAMLCQSLAIDRRLDQTDLVDSTEVFIAEGTMQPDLITSTARIGVTRSKRRRLRFFVDGNWYVSGRVGDHQRRPIDGQRRED